MAKIIQKTLQNILTSFRCISALIVPFLIVYGDEIGAVLAPVIFIIACFTDFFDGYFARKYNVVSNYGRIIDPVADKMLVVGTLIGIFQGLFICRNSELNPRTKNIAHCTNKTSAQSINKTILKNQNPLC